MKTHSNSSKLMDPVPCGSYMLLVRNSDDVLSQMEIDGEEHEVMWIGSKNRIEKGKLKLLP